MTLKHITSYINVFKARSKMILYVYKACVDVVSRIVFVRLQHHTCGVILNKLTYTCTIKHGSSIPARQAYFNHKVTCESLD